MSFKYEPASEPLHISVKQFYPQLKTLHVHEQKETLPALQVLPSQSHPGGNPGANLKSISHRCYLFEVAFVWELTKETIVLPLGCLQGGCHPKGQGRVG